MGEKTVLYDEIRDTLKTGDIVLFHGLGWENGLIRAVEFSQWSHVAMLVRVAEIEFPMIWESTPLQLIEDVLLHRRKSGVRLVSLDERLAIAVEKRFYAKIAIRRLEVERTSEMMEALRNFISGRVHYLPYPSDWQMLLEFIQGRLLKEENEKFDNFFCTELISETYKRMGLLSGVEPSNRFMPKDFSSEGRLSLLKGAKLGKEIYLLLERNLLQSS